MSDAPASPVEGPSGARNGGRARFDLFLISLLILFLELACIRWLPAHVLFLTFFSNVVLLACFLGMSLGCLMARRPRQYLPWTPALLCLTLLAGLLVDIWHEQLSQLVKVQPNDPRLIYFGTESQGRTTDSFGLPIEVVAGGFFLLLTLTMIGPGQALGQALDRLPQRLQAYSWNVLGSLAGIVLFSILSWQELAPVWWFLPVVLLLGYLLWSPDVSPAPPSALLTLGPMVLILALVTFASLRNFSTLAVAQETIWSPYYRINYLGPESRHIEVNLLGHQRMVPTSSARYAYGLPYYLNHDAGNPPFEDVLIIGAGSGNDVGWALRWGVERIDAVEIDPVIQRLGKRDHPDKPYSKEYEDRVSVHIGDGRNFLRATERKYDLIVYALVDSLVLHSGYSSLRLESYLFTEQAMQEVHSHLKPGGLFFMSNYFRHGWLMERMEKQVAAAFHQKPTVLLFPPRDRVGPDEYLNQFGAIFAGDNPRLQAALQKSPSIWLPQDLIFRQDQHHNCFTPPTPEEQASGNWWECPRLIVEPASESLRPATDDWPFLYLREPMIPLRPSLTGMAVMGGLALVLLFVFRPRSTGKGPAFDGRMFFLGAGFMLIETKAVVHMALLFGSTWSVNSYVFFAVLVMILLANLFVLKVRPVSVWPWYAGLFAALALNALVPLDSFLGLSWVPQVGLSCLLVFAPILFAGVIFALSFAGTAEADRAFGANIAGAMLGGLLENASMVLGFRNLMFLAMALYALSALLGGRRQEGVKEVPQDGPVPSAAL